MDEEFDAILADYLKAQDRNAAPSQDEMLLRHPRHREALAAFFDGDSAINCLATDDAPIGELLPVGITFAGCRITGTAGIGGSGVVYEAEQLEPRRPVALKVLSVGSVPAASAAARFRQEAELTARLHHPRIVPIHAFGVEAGRPYLILAWLPGGTAAARLHEFPIVPAEAASVVRDVAAAVAHAHENAVLHRDLKPANILFDERGSPCLADFGFAAPLVRDLRLTQAGTFAGTAEYSSPEQNGADGGQITVRTDVHGLGAVLYALLTGKAPFAGEHLSDVLNAVLKTVPPAPRSVNPRVPTDLNTICLKCLEKQPQRRYATAQQVQTDLDNFLNSRPLIARPVGRVRRLHYWAKRRPGRAAATATSLVAGLVLLVVAGFGLTAYREAKQDIRTANESAATARFFNSLELVRKRRRDAPFGWTLKNLSDLTTLAADPHRGQTLLELRTEAALALSGHDLISEPDLDPGYKPYAVAYHPTEPIVVLSEWNRDGDGSTTRLCAIDRTTGAILSTWTAPTDAAWRAVHGKFDFLMVLQFSPDGKTLAGGSRSGRVLSWPWPITEAPPSQAKLFERSVGDLAFNRDGKLLFAGSLGTLNCLRVRMGGIQPLPGQAINMNGNLPAIADVRAAAADPLAEYLEAYPNTLPTVLNHGPGGRAKLTATSNGAVELRVAPEWAIVGYSNARHDGTQNVFGQVTRTRWSNDGRLFALSDETAELAELWDMNAFRPFPFPIRLNASTDAKPSCVPAFASDGREFGIVAHGSLRRYRRGGDAVQRFIGWSAVPISLFACDPTGRRLVTLASADNLRTIRTFGVDDAVAADPPLNATVRPRCAYLQMPQAETVVMYVDNPPAEAQLLRLPPGPPLTPLFRNIPDIENLAVAPDGTVWASSGHELRTLPLTGVGPMKLFASGAALRAAGMTMQVLCPHAGGCLAGRRDGTLLSFDAEARLIRELSVFRERFTTIARDAAGRYVVVGSLVGEVAVLDGPASVVIHRPESHAAAVTAAAVNSDGLIATGSLDRTVQLRNAAGAILLTLPFDAAVGKLCFSPDGATLFVLTAGDRAVRKWNLRELGRGLRDLGLGVDELPS